MPTDRREEQFKAPVGRFEVSRSGGTGRPWRNPRIQGAKDRNRGGRTWVCPAKVNFPKAPTDRREEQFKAPV